MAEQGTRPCRRPVMLRRRLAARLFGALSATVAALTTGGLQVICVSKMKIVLAVLLTVSALGLGVGICGRRSLHGGTLGKETAVDPAAIMAAFLHGSSHACDCRAV